VELLAVAVHLPIIHRLHKRHHVQYVQVHGIQYVQRNWVTAGYRW
jgi:hypothetical protein